MVLYRDGSKFFSSCKSNAFNQTYFPGAATPHSGIYRCDACGFEAVSIQGRPLPRARSCTDHKFTFKCAPGTVRWRLVACAEHYDE